MMNFSSRINRFVIALIGVMVLGISSVYAGTGYTHGRAFLRPGNPITPTGGGKVYVAANATAPSDSQYKAVTSSTSPAFDVKNASTQTYHFWAKANAGYIFTGWYDENDNIVKGTDGVLGSAHISKSVTQPTAGENDEHAYADYYAGFIKQIQMSFIEPMNGSFSVTNAGTAVTPAYSSFTVNGRVLLTATPADGYKLRGWYYSTNGGATKNYFAFGPVCEPNFTSNVTIGADFVPDNGKASFWIKGTNNIYDDLGEANTAAAAASSKMIVVVSDGLVTAKASPYTISSGVTLLIPYNETYNTMTTPQVRHYTRLADVPALSAFRKLTLASGATINVSGTICIGGSQSSVNGGNPSSSPCGPVGVLDLSQGGTINLNSGSVLYAWGFVKGQDMDQGNNTTASGVGVINAASGAVVWEDYQVGEWRGGTASKAIWESKSSWKFFPFQSYSIQNIEVPVNYAFGSNLKCYWSIYGNGRTYSLDFPLIASSNSLFILKSGGSIKKWYDPTTDRVCFELSGASEMNALILSIMGQSVSSADYNLPIPANLKISLASGTSLTIAKPMTIHAGAVVEIKSGATLKLNSNVYLYDKDDWDMYCMYKYYYRTYKNLTLHYDRGTGTSKTNLEDATVIVDGTLDLTGSGRLYATAHGANVYGNSGGTIKYGTLPGNTTMTQCKELKDNVSVNIRSANMHNDNDTYTKGTASTIFKNVNGRWFTNANSTWKSDKTFNFTYIKSGDVYGTGGTNGTVKACYSKDKTGLVLQDKWANVKAEGCSGWFVGIDDSHLYNYTRNNAWHQYIKTGSVTTGTGEEAVTTDTYVGSDGKILEKTECAVVEAGTIDEDCLYPSSRALVNGSLITVAPNASPDHGYHKSDAATTYYLCFEGCVWHPATRDAENFYTVDGTKYIWYDDDDGVDDGGWLAVQKDATVNLYYSLSATNVKIYYEYVNHAWVLATPVAEVVTSTSTEQVFSLASAVVKAAAVPAGGNVTIRLLKNISGTINYTTGNNCGLDLNGFTLSSSTNNMITVDHASANFIIKDLSPSGAGKVRLSFSANNDRRRAIYVKNGHCILNSGTVEVVNTLKYDATNETTKANTNKTYATGVYVATGKQFTMNGGVLNVTCDYNPYGINSDGSASSKSTTTINGGTINVVSEVRDSPYAIYGPATINMNGGTVNSTAVKSTSAMGIYVYGSGTNVGTLNMTGGTINASSTKNSTAIGIYVGRGVAYDTNEPRTQTAEYPCIANISGGTVNATTDATTGTTTTEAVRSYGTTTITGGRFVSKPRTTTAYGVRIYTGTTTISGSAEFDVQATSTAYGICVGNEQPSTGGVVYNTGTAIVNGGTFTVKTTSGADAYGIYVGANSRAVTTTHASNSSYYAGNYANAGTATLNNGEFVVTSATTNGYAIFVKAAVTQSGASGYASATATPKCTVNGGKYKITSTNGSAVYANNTAATVSNFSMAGGYYNVAPTNNIAAGKSVQDVVRAKEQAIYDAGYVKKIRGNEYTVTWMNYNGTTLLGTTQVESDKVPVWTGETPTYNTSTATLEFDGWSTEKKNGGTTYLNGAALPAIVDADVTYYAHYKTIYAEVIAGGSMTRYSGSANTAIQNAWNATKAYTNATLRILSNYGTEAAGGKCLQLVFNPTNANSTLTFDLNGHSWVHGNHGTASNNKDIFLHVNPAQANCKLIITDNSASGDGYLMNKQARTDGVLLCAKVSTGELILQGGRLRVNNTADAENKKYSVGVQVNGSTQFTMTGGEVYATDAYSPRGINVSPSGNADIVGGTVHADATGGNAYGVLAYGTVAVGGDALVKATTAGSGAYPGYVDGGTLTVADSCSVVATAPSNARDLYVFNAGKITVNDKPTITATVTSGSEAYGCYVSGSGSEIEVNGGTYELTGAAASGSVMGVRAISSGVATINNGTFTLQGGNNWTFGVFAQSGTVNINGGEFTVSQASGGNKEGIRVYPTATCNVTGGTFTVTTIGSSGGNALHAYGGTTNISGNPVFNAYYGITVADGNVASEATTATVVVDGGTYNTQSFGVKSRTTSPTTGDVTIWDGKFKSAAGWNVLDNSSYTECLKIRGGWFSNNSSGKLATGSGNFVVSPSTVETLTSGPEFEAGYKYHVISKYNVTWSINGVNTVQEYSRNETPSYGSTPTIDDGNTWEFLGWSPEIVPVTADATYTAQFTKYEAEVTIPGVEGSKLYESFVTAWNEAQDQPNATIKLLSNVSLSTQVTLNPTTDDGSKPLTLDLNNHTLQYTGTDDRFIVVSKTGCKLIITDNSLAKGGKVKVDVNRAEHIIGVASHYGDLELQGGEIYVRNSNASAEAWGAYPCKETNFTMTGGTISTYARANAKGVYTEWGSIPTVTISGGSVLASTEYDNSGTPAWGNNAYGVYARKGGKITISGTASITAHANQDAYAAFASGNGGVYGEISIKGGTVTAIVETKRVFGAYADIEGKIDIEGGAVDGHSNVADVTSMWNVEGAHCAGGAILNISGGEITSSNGASPIGVSVHGGTTTISGGKISSTYALYAVDYAAATQTATVNIHGGTFIATAEAVRVEGKIRDSSIKNNANVTVNGGYFYSTGGYLVRLTNASGAEPSTLVLNGGKYCEKSGTTYKTQITNLKGGTTSITDINETVDGKTYKYELLTDFNITWLGGSSYSKVTAVQCGTVPTNNELVGKSFIRNDSAFYFTGWTPTPSAVIGEATYNAVGDYHEASVKVGSAEPIIYDDFDEAWSYAMDQTSATITLLSNITRTTSIVYSPSSESARHTFDLNNFTIKENTADRLLIVNKSDAKLTITDNSSEKGGCLYKKMSSSANMYVSTIYHGELILAGGKIYAENTSTSDSWHPAIAVHVSQTNDGDSKFTMTGGIAESQAKYLAYPLYNYCTMNIEGGTIIANATGKGSSLGIYSVNGTATVSGGTFNISASSSAIGALAGGWINGDGSNIQNGTLNITGGTFNVSATSENAHAIQATGTGRNVGGTIYTAHGIMNVSGGTFNVTCSATTATQVFAGQCVAWRLFDDALPHNMIGEAKGEMNISGGTFTVDTRDNGAWVENKGNIDLLRCWGNLNVTGGNFTIHQNNSNPCAIGVYRGKATVSDNPVFNVYAHTSNARGVQTAIWTSENYCDRNAANNLAEAEINGGTYNIITEGNNTEGVYALGAISAESRDGEIITAHAGYAMNAKITVNGGEFLCICPNANERYPMVFSSAADREGTYGTAKSEIYVNGGKVKSRKGTEADNTSTGAVNCHNATGKIWLTGGYYETNAQLADRIADSCEVVPITSAAIDPEYNNGYRYRIDVNKRVKVESGGETRYYSDALKALNYARTAVNPTITLLQDAPLTARWVINPANATIPDNWQGILDFNGHTLTGTGSTYGMIDIAKAGIKLTIRDSSSGKTGKLTHDEPQDALWGINVAVGELVLESGTIYVNNTKAAGSTYGIVANNNANAKITITGGTVDVHATTATAIGVYINTSGSATISGTSQILVTSTNAAYGVYNSGANATATISGGTIRTRIGTNNASIGVYTLYNATTTINNCTIYAQTDVTASNVAAVRTSGGTATINDGDFHCEGYQALSIRGGNTIINGGTFTAKTGIRAMDWADAATIAATCTINGGTFNTTDITIHVSSNSANNSGKNAHSDVTVNGGRFKSTGATIVYMGAAPTGTTESTLTINGGYFNEKAGGSTFKNQIGNFKGSGKEIIDLDTDDAEYIAGYRYIVTTDPVAKVKNGSEVTYYAAVKDALDYFKTKNNATLTMLDNDTFTGKYTLIPTISNWRGTWDLNNMAVTCTSASYAMMDLNKADAILTITDNSEAKGGRIEHVEASAAGAVWGMNIENGEVVLQAGTIRMENTQSGASGTKVGMSVKNANSRFTMIGGRVEAAGENNARAIELTSGTATISGGKIVSIPAPDGTLGGYAYGIYTSGTASLTVEGADSIYAKAATRAYSLYVNGGTAKIEGTPFFVAESPAAGARVLQAGSTGSITVNGGTFESKAGTTDSYALIAEGNSTSSPSITVNGGKFKSNQSNIAYKNSYAALTINGGYYNETSGTTHKTKIDSYKGSGKVILNLEEGDAEYIAGYRYLVTDDPVAKVKTGSTTTYYTTAKRALDYAKTVADPTITLLANCTLTEGNYTINPGATWTGTLDLNNYTLTPTIDAGTGRAFTIGGTGTKFIVTDKSEDKGGKIYYKDNWSACNIIYFVVASGEMELAGGTLYVEDTNNSMAVIGFVVDGNPSQFTQSGGTFTVKSNGSAKGYYGKGTATFKGGTMNVESTAQAIGLYPHESTSVLNVSGSFALNVTSSTADSYGVLVKNSGATGTINGGKFKFNQNTIVAAQSSGSLTINGGYFNEYGSTTTYKTQINNRCVSPKHPIELTAAEQAALGEGGTDYKYKVVDAYTLTWTTDGDALTGDYTSGMTAVGATIVQPNTPTKTGYTFAAWTPAVAATMPAENTTYTATWTEKSYTVTFYNGSHGTVKVAGSMIANGGTASVNHFTTKTLAATASTGYTFAGWTKTGSVTIGNTANASTNIKATAAGGTVTATWTANNYTITYKDQGDAAFSGVHGDGYPTSHTYGTATALVSPTKTGYTFGGWYTTSACTGDAVTSLGATAFTADITLYAKWTRDTYTISYDLAGGSVASPNPTSYTVESSAITLNNPTKTGYTFAGWTGTGLDAATTTVTIAAGSTGNRSYTATWTINSYAIRFLNYDGSVLQSSSVNYGETPVYSGETPSKPADATYTYTFDTWSPAITAVSKAQDYTAQFSQTANVASVTVGDVTTYYTTLQDAFNYAANKTEPTIQVLSNIALAAKVTYTNTSKTTVTFDLNGHTISGGANGLLTLTSATSTGGMFVIKSSVEGGQIRNVLSSTGARYCVALSKGKLTLQSGTIYNENTSTGASYAVSGGRPFTMTGGKLHAKAQATAYGAYITGGTSTISGGEIKAETSGNTASAVFATGGTTTLKGTIECNISGASNVSGAIAGGAKPASDKGTLYNGKLIIEGGTFNVTAGASGTAYGVYSTGGSRPIHYSTSSTYAGNYADAGDAEVKGGVFTVKGKKTYGIGSQGTVTINTAEDADGNTTYEAASATPKVTVTGGKFDLQGTSTKAAVVATSAIITNTDVVIEGGWYNVATNLNQYTAPTKSCNYHVLPLAGESPYAWEVAEAYTLTWDLVGGTVTTAGTVAPVEATGTPSGVVKKGASLTAPTVTKTGYTFAAWSPAVAATMPSANTTYTATWTAKNYSITYYDLGSTSFTGSHASGYPTSHTYGTATTLKTATKSGYTFGGWYTASDCASGKVTSLGATAYTANITLYAKWTQSVTLHDNNGGSNNGSATATFNAGGPLSVSAPTRTGYTVEGYYAEAACTHKVMTAAGALVNYSGYVSSSKWIHSGATTLYAKWTEDTHTVTVAAGANGSASPTSVTAGISTASGTITATPNTGYHFVNWTIPDGVTIASGSTTSTSITINATADDKTITANFAENSYDVTFYNGGHGTVKVAGTTISNGGTASVNHFTTKTLAVTANTGYTFAGWTKTGSVTIGNTANASTNIKATATGGTVTATWTADQYSVTLDREGGTSGATSVTMTYDANTLGGYSAPTRTGYTFGGYWTGDNGTGTLIITTEGALTSATVSGYTSSGKWIKTTSTTLYAKWTRNNYTISYTLNGGSVAVDNPTSYHVETATFTLNNPTKTGYTFAGWTGTGLDAATMTVTIAAGSTGDRSYTATWTPNTYSVRFNKNDEGATGTMSNEAFTYDVAKALTANAFTKTGYNFDGWATSAGGDVVYTDGQSVSNLSSTQGAVVDLYAKWSAATYEVTLDQNGATTSGSTSVTMTYGSAEHSGITNPKKTGYSFKGWYTSAGGGTRIIKSDGTLGTKTGYVEDGVWVRTTATTLYAGWTQTVKLDKNGGSADGSATSVRYKSSSNLTITAPTREGFSIEGYYAEPACTHKVVTAAGALVNYSGYVESDKWVHAGATTLYTKWIEDTHTVTVAADANGSASPASVTAGISTASGDITATPNTGYHFVNWTLPDGVTAASTYTASSNPIRINATADDKTITANFAENSYDVTFYNGSHGTVKVAGSTIANGGTASVNHFTTKTLAATASTGYTFAGWTKTGSVTIGNTANASTNIKATAAGGTVTATWTANSYTITYKDQGDAAFSGVHGDGYPTSHTYGTATALVSPTKTGYTFGGWYTTSACTGDAVTSLGATAYTANITLYAKWTINSYTITFDSNGGSAVSSITQNYGTAVTPPSNPTKTGYTFASWSPAVPATMPASNTTCVAQWTANTNTAYTVKHYKQNVAGDGYDLAETDNLTGTTGASVTPAVKSYTGFTAPSTQTETIAADGSLVIEYQYTRISYTLTWALDGGSITAAGTAAGSVKYGASLTAPTVTKSGFNFTGWSPSVPATMPASDATYTATWELADVGAWLDIVDVDNSESKLIVNVNSWAANGWPYSINGVSYAKEARESDRTLKIPYTGAPGDNFVIAVQKNGGAWLSNHTYVIPQEITSNTTISAGQTKNIFVKNGANLTVNANIAVKNIYVAPGSKLTINSGKTLTADTIFLRTTVDRAAELLKNGSIANTTQLVYTRIVKDKDFHLFGLPLSCPVSSVHLSDGLSPAYTTGWVLRSYDEARRAASGADDNNWATLAAGGTIAGGAGYELFSASNYYREFYFPVDLKGLTNQVAVSYHLDAAGEKNAGWNAIASPFTYTYENAKVPEGLVVNWYMDGYGYYAQEIPSTIPPASVFAFQATKNGYLSFEGSSIVVNAPRRRAAAEESVRIQWINLDVTDANGVGDQTSIYSHPTRYEQEYKTGIDVEKQSLTAARAILYTTHTYGDMAFAGVSDSLLEVGVPLTVYSPTAQELTISMRDNDWLNRMAYVWLIDHETGAQTDLLTNDYVFEAAEGTTAGRFTIQGRFHSPQITTEIENGQSDKAGQAVKFIYQDKMYILLNGRVYDATGKLVNSDK